MTQPTIHPITIRNHMRVTNREGDEVLHAIDYSCAVTHWSGTAVQVLRSGTIRENFSVNYPSGGTNGGVPQADIAATMAEMLRLASIELARLNAAEEA